MIEPGHLTSLLNVLCELHTLIVLIDVFRSNSGLLTLLRSDSCCRCWTRPAAMEWIKGFVQGIKDRLVGAPEGASPKSLAPADIKTVLVTFESVLL
jgi:hypothetical protein